jgi:hypothetical protein
MTRAMSIAAIEFRAPAVVNGTITIEIGFNPRSNELLGLPMEDEQEASYADTFRDELDLLGEACAAGFFGTGERRASFDIEPGDPERIRLRARDLDVAGLAALALSIDCVSQARLGMLDELECRREELEQISRLSVQAEGSLSLEAALQRLKSGPRHSAVSTFVDNEPLPLSDFLEIEGKGRRLDMELVFDAPPDEPTLSALRRIGTRWEALVLASALNADASGRDWVVDERDVFGGAEVSAGKGGTVFAYYEDFEGSPAAALWFLDAVQRMTGRSPASYINLVDQDSFDPGVRLADL